MKRLFSLICMSFLLSAGIGCSNNNISLNEAKEIAAEQIDGVFPEDITSCETINVNGKNIYRVCYENHDEFLRYEVDIDPSEEDVLQIESESLAAPSVEDIGKESAKQVVLNDIKEKDAIEVSDSDIIRCTYSNVDAEYINNDKPPYYDIILYKDKGNGETLYSYHINALTGAIESKEIKESIDPSEYNNVKQTNSTANAENADRPVWLVAHRCNTNYYNKWYSKLPGTLRPESKRDVHIALDGGCNGVEVDIRHRRDGTLRLCHDCSCTINNSESVEEFLALPEMSDSRMCVVIFDMKEPEYFQDLANKVHAAMKSNEKLQKINFIYSIDKLKYARQYFTKAFVDSLKLNEGICVDYHDSADEIEGLYTDLKFYRGWYGDGIFSGIASRATTRGCQRAIAIRNRSGEPAPHIQRVENWTVNTERRFRDRLGGWGLDSVMLSGRMTKKASKVLGQVPGVRLAKQEDKMFKNI